MEITLIPELRCLYQNEHGQTVKIYNNGDGTMSVFVQGPKEKLISMTLVEPDDSYIIKGG